MTEKLIWLKTIILVNVDNILAPRTYLLHVPPYIPFYSISTVLQKKSTGTL